MSSKIPELKGIKTYDAARFLGMTPELLRKEADADEIESERDENNHRTFTLAALMTYHLKREAKAKREARERRRILNAERQRLLAGAK
jgi:hypothetical protein